MSSQVHEAKVSTTSVDSLVMMLPRRVRRTLGNLRPIPFVQPDDEPTTALLAAAGMASEPDAGFEVGAFAGLCRALVAAHAAGELRSVDGLDPASVSANAAEMLRMLGPDPVVTVDKACGFSRSK